MEITTTILGFVGLGIVAVVAIVLAWWPRRRAMATRLVAWSASSGRHDSRSFTDWFAGDPVLFVGGDAAPADCGAADGGGGGCH